MTERDFYIVGTAIGLSFILMAWWEMQFETKEADDEEMEMFI